MLAIDRKNGNYTIHTSCNLNVTRGTCVSHARATLLYTSIFTSIHAITRNRIYLPVQAHMRNHHLFTRKDNFSTHTRIQVSRRMAKTMLALQPTIRFRGTVVAKLSSNTTTAWSF